MFGVADEIAFDHPRLDDFAASLAKDTFVHAVHS
jgi:hypothetical protein